MYNANRLSFLFSTWASIGPTFASDKSMQQSRSPVGG